MSEGKDDNIIPFDGHITKTEKALERRNIGTDKPIVVSGKPRKGGGEVKHNGVTAKQEGFARRVGLEGMTFKAAYMASYDASKMKESSIYNEGYKLSCKPEIAARIDWYVKQKQARASHNPEKIRAKIVQTLEEMAGNEANRMSDRLKAIELLGKVDYVGIFKERSVVETDTLTDPEQIKQRITDLLKTGTDNS